MRHEIVEFAEEMERVMKKHDPQKGDSWKGCNRIFLWDKLEEEWKEVKALNENYTDTSLDAIYVTDEKRRKELVDLANVCMMLWNRLKSEKESL